MKKVIELLSMLTWDLGFQDPATGLAEALVRLYNIVGVFMVLIFVMVAYLFMIILIKCNFRGGINDDVFTTKGIFNQMFINTLGFFRLANMYSGKRRGDFLKIYDIAEYRFVEKVWTLFPAGVLLSIVVPSLSVEYWLDPKVSPFMVVKVVGNQWFWSYECAVNLTKLGVGQDVNWFEYSNLHKCWVDSMKEDYLNPEVFRKNLLEIDPVTKVSYSFDSNLIEPSSSDGVNPQRLLDVDNRLVLPVGVPIRVLITSADVLHCWAVPSLGVKVDAVPGRLSSFMVYIDRPGLFFGQCSELCGPMHGFMPIVVESVRIPAFIEYVLEGLEKPDTTSLFSTSDYKESRTLEEILEKARKKK